MNTGRVFGTAKCVLFIEVSAFQGVLIREVPLYVYMKQAIMVESDKPAIPGQ